MLIGSHQRMNTFHATPSLAIDKFQLGKSLTQSHWAHILMGSCPGMFTSKNCVKKLLVA